VRSSLFAGRSYSQWQQRHYGLQRVKLNNVPLAKEVADAAQQANGILTFAEYLAIDQFGEHGYHARHQKHGFQDDLHAAWAEKLVDVCLKEHITHVVDVGCGDGNLGIKLLQAAKKANVPLTWTGIEVNERLHPSIRSAFKEAKLEKQLVQIETTVDKCLSQNNTLLIFAFSLDSVPPEAFVNEGTEQTYPNTLIGVQVENGYLQEVYLTEEQLRQKGRKLLDGVYIDALGKQFDLRSWRLHPQQRLYLSVSAFSLLGDCIARFPNSFVLLIDEFYLKQPTDASKHIFGPKSLLTFNRDYAESVSIYTEAGENLYYYPTFLSVMLSFLQARGFHQIAYNYDYQIQKIYPEELAGKECFCLTIFASRKKWCKKASR
jgi:phospholipid N-methyltransferase